MGRQTNHQIFAFRRSSKSCGLQVNKSFIFNFEKFVMVLTDNLMNDMFQSSSYRHDLSCGRPYFV